MNYTDFRRMLITDKAFANKFSDCKDADALVAAAAQEGYEFTADDVKNNTELLPEELEHTVGGVSFIAPSNDFVSNPFTAQSWILG